MRGIRHIAYLAGILLASSCMTENDVMPDPPTGSYPSVHLIKGQVIDSEKNSLEHIRVTIDWNGGTEKSVKYTASDGSFIAEFPEASYNDGMAITITLDDIDGEKNGGLFESLTDKLIISNAQFPIGVLVYRLNRATASGNSPQS